MRGREFLDSNILIYALTDTESGKQPRARELVARPRVVISTQVLLETSNVLIRKVGAHPADVARVLRSFLNREVVSHTPGVVEESWRIAERYGFSIYDSAIVACALASKCTTLYTEDLQHGQMIEGLRVSNPFA
jgi:predicted nucleic acid-binding protein